MERFERVPHKLCNECAYLSPIRDDLYHIGSCGKVNLDADGGFIEWYQRLLNHFDEVDVFLVRLRRAREQH